MKKFSSATVLLILYTLTSLAYGDPIGVDCTSSGEFEKNACEVCYTDTFDAQQTPTGWASTVNMVKIPWKHAGGDLDEIIYNIEQKYPEIRTTLNISTKPTKPEDLWANHESLVWIPMVDHQEYVLKKGEEIGVYKLAQNASITIQGTKPDDTFMMLLPLVFRDFDAKTNQDTEPKTRNICVQGKFVVKNDSQIQNNVGSTVVHPAIPTNSTTSPETQKEVSDTTALGIDGTVPSLAQSDMTSQGNDSGDVKEMLGTTFEEAQIEDLAPLDSAGEEEMETITKDQTTTQTGPTLWIVLVLAFAFSGAWSAWKKQKV